MGIAVLVAFGDDDFEGFTAQVIGPGSIGIREPHLVLFVAVLRNGALESDGAADAQLNFWGGRRGSGQGEDGRKEGEERKTKHAVITTDEAA